MCCSWPGCGKSTQLPQFLLRAGYTHVACTQPRRISAIALCRRCCSALSYELFDHAIMGHSCHSCGNNHQDCGSLPSQSSIFQSTALLLACYAQGGQTLACRVAFETLQEHRDDIAYRVRFDSTAGRGTKVTFLTEGVLLRMLTSDPKLPQFQVVIIDEVRRHSTLYTLLSNSHAS